MPCLIFHSITDVDEILLRRLRLLVIRIQYNLMLPQKIDVDIGVNFDVRVDVVVHEFKLLNSSKGKPSYKKSAVFFNIAQKAFGPPPPFYLNICPILQGVFFKTRFCRE